MRRCRIVGLVAVLAVAGATGARAQEDTWKGETFLSDYSVLEAVPGQPGREFIYVAPGAEPKLAQVTAVMVDQPEVSLSSESPYRSAKPDDLKAVAEFVRSTIVGRLQARGFKVAAQGGPSVLLVRVAVTELQLKKKRRGLLAYTPAGAVVHGVVRAVEGMMKNVDILDLRAQGEVSAADTGEVLGAVVFARAVPVAPRPERLSFEELRAYVETYSDRMACRLANARRPAEQRVDCLAEANAALPRR